VVGTHGRRGRPRDAHRRKWRPRRAALWERPVSNVPLSDLFEAGTLRVNYDSHCCRDLGFPVTGHFYGEVSSSACWLA
jgi:hypothetical protein